MISTKRLWLIVALVAIPHQVCFVECLPHPENVNRPSSFGDIPYQLDSYFENPLLTIFQLFCVQRIRCPLPSPGLAIEEFVQLVGNNGKKEEDRGLDEVVRESFWLSCLHVGTKVA